jgi:hypothetical protein
MVVEKGLSIEMMKDNFGHKSDCFYQWLCLILPPKCFIAVKNRDYRLQI